jgi:hypothetical protein|tara:strand:- start:831 stop:1361 length:531 start_codon:yes stop_codon:yes gene_type:complete
MLSEKVFKSGYDVTSNSKLAGSEKNDCFVRACSNAFNISYEAAHEFVADRFDRKNGKGTKMCNLKMKELQKEVLEFQPEGQLSLFSDNGGKRIKLKHIGDTPKVGGRLINRSYTHKKVAYTVKTFMQKFTKGTYILLVNKHALVCKNGIIIDNGDMQFGGYRRPVESAFKIEEELN